MIQDIFVDQAVRGYPLVRRIHKKLGGKAPVVLSDPRELYKLVNRQADPVSQGKQVLFLTRNRGPFIRKCPGTKSYLCCGYQILHIATYCTMDCSYCVLQSYFKPPVLQFFVNQETLFKELDEFFAYDHPPFRRIGTGEFTDSLIWEPWTGISRTLITRFAKQTRAVLELKTKTSNVDFVHGLTHNRKTILAWSINLPAVIHGEERGTASLHARLRAAAQCQSLGYPLAFHFDPIILYKGWKEGYRDLVGKLFSMVSPENIVWISLGSLRFNPSLKPIIQRRFPGSKIVYGEFIPGIDGKMRYFKPLRIKLYRNIVNWIRQKAPDVGIYFCMEDEEIWEKVLGFVPEKKGGLSRLLDGYAKTICELTR